MASYYSNSNLSHTLNSRMATLFINSRELLSILVFYILSFLCSHPWLISVVLGENLVAFGQAKEFEEAR